jgi:hypothetical protein
MVFVSSSNSKAGAGMPEETGIINVLSLQRSMRAIIPAIIFGVGKVSQIFSKNHSKFERKTQPRLVTFS